MSSGEALDNFRKPAQKSSKHVVTFVKSEYNHIMGSTAYKSINGVPSEHTGLRR
jgi:hypothetical protein